MQSDKELREQLEAVFNLDEIKFRIAAVFGNPKAARLVVVPYVTSRAIQDRLDDIFGIFGWSDKYIEVNGGYRCILTTTFDGKTITKEDGAETIQRFPIKGTISDALKRAAVKYGIGRYLYRLPKFDIWGTIFLTKPSDEERAKFDDVFYHKFDNDKCWIGWKYPELPIWATKLSADQIQGFIDKMHQCATVEELKEVYEHAFTAIKINNLKSMIGPLKEAKDEAKKEIVAKENHELELARKTAEENLKESIQNLIKYQNTKAACRSFVKAALPELEGFPDLQQQLKDAAEKHSSTLKV